MTLPSGLSALAKLLIAMWLGKPKQELDLKLLAERAKWYTVESVLHQISLLLSVFRLGGERPCFNFHITGAASTLL